MNTQVSRAVAGALALAAAAGAHAVDLSGVSTSNILYVGGSTAIDNGIIQRFTNATDGLCGANIDIYTDTNTGVKFTAVACTSGAHATSFGIASGTSIAVVKEDNAGSANGIIPVNGNTTLAFPNVTTATNANCGAASPHSCNASVTASSIVPQFGFADVNAELFGASTSNLNASSSVDTLFGVAASLGFYHALQQVQLGLTGTNADDALADMPSLTRGQVYTMLQELVPPSIIVNSAGTLNTGSTTQLFGTNTNANSFCGHATTPCATNDANDLFICERGQSSGTQQTTQVYFGGIGCAGGVPALAAPTQLTCQSQGCSWGSSFANDVVFAGNGTGDVLSCLQAHDAAGQMAIGVVGIENGWGVYQSNAARKDWRFVKLNGVAPSYENVASDRYQYWAQSASYAPKSGRPNVATGVAGDIATAFVQVGSVGTIAALNSAFNYTAPAFDGGFLAIPGLTGNNPNSSSATLAAFRANPVNSYNRGAPAATNDCIVPILDLTAPDTADYPAWAGP